MKTYKEFLTEAKKKVKDNFKKALKSYQKEQQNKARAAHTLSQDTEPKSKERSRLLQTALLPNQGATPVIKNLKVVDKLRKAAQRALKKGKSPEKIRAKIEKSTHQSSPGPYKPAATYNPANVPKPGSVTAHDGSTQKVNWNH